VCGRARRGSEGAPGRDRRGEAVQHLPSELDAAGKALMVS